MGIIGFVLLTVAAAVAVDAQLITDSGDAAAIQDIKNNFKLPSSVNWSDPDPCKWSHIQCSGGRITSIQIGNNNVAGTVSPAVRNLTALRWFDVMNCGLSGSLPSFSGLSNLKVVYLNNNNFISVPTDFFQGLTSLETVDIGFNDFPSWTIPDSIRDATALRHFSAIQANITGNIPAIFDSTTFPSLVNLHLSFNNFEGGLPASFVGSSLQSLWLNGKPGNSLLTGTLNVLANMTELVEVWLHYNRFTGPIPDLSSLKNLQWLSLRDNQLTGLVPASLTAFPSLMILNLTNNLLQGPMPQFSTSWLKVDMVGANSFCLSDPGYLCDARVNNLLSIAQTLGYPLIFAQSWTGNDPCDPSKSWTGITCSGSNITIVNLQKLGLSGTISSDYSKILSLQKLSLADNNLTGPIPEELASLPNLSVLDVSNNNLSGPVPSFGPNVLVNTTGNPLIKSGSP